MLLSIRIPARVLYRTSQSGVLAYTHPRCRMSLPWRHVHLSQSQARVKSTVSSNYIVGKLNVVHVKMAELPLVNPTHGSTLKVRHASTSVTRNRTITQSSYKPNSVKPTTTTLECETGAPTAVKHTSKSKDSVSPKPEVLYTPKSTTTMSDVDTHESALSSGHTSGVTPNTFPVSELDVPMLPECLRSVLFGERINDPEHDKKVRRAISHLKSHNLLMNRMPPSSGEEEKVRLIKKLKGVPLEGKNIEEHYKIIGDTMASPYFEWALLQTKTELPIMPSKWVVKSGWTRYTHQQPEGVAVAAPLEAVLVFDVETLIDKNGLYHFPTMAVAASTDAWYSWCSQKLDGTKPNVPEQELIPFDLPEEAGVPRNSPRLIIGHNVSFDRSKIAEEYHLGGTNNRFLDTLSMHMCYSGMSSGQRSLWHATQKQPSYSRKVWISETSTNGLDQVYKLYKGRELDKAVRNIFKTGTLSEVQEKAQELFTYCATDVQATFEVYKVIGSNWFPTINSITFAGMLEMGSTYLPVSNDWFKFVDVADKALADRMNTVEDNLLKLAQECLDKYPDFAEQPPTDDPWVKHLDWTLPRGKLKRTTLQNKPKWYRDLCKTKGSDKPVITTRTRVAPYLLRLRWNNHPVIYDTTIRSWGYMEAKKISKKRTYKSESNPVVDEDLKAPAGQSEFESVSDEESVRFFVKLPHSAGDGSNVGNPLAKSFLGDIEAGVLSSQYPEAKEALEKAAECSYWISAKSRVKNQMVYKDPTSNVMAIIPMLLSAGTVTRRAVEATWLTASNAKENRVGSELKAQVRAPPGYKLVGADVDSQELWIAAVMGDAKFCGLHGSTAMGWMALRGQKADGTDVHSRTAALVGLDRNTAKIFNYGRIYGAGQAFATRLLLQHNRSIEVAEGKKRAHDLYINTKGTRWLKIAPHIAEEITRERPELKVAGQWTTVETLQAYYRGVKRNWESEAIDVEWRHGTESHMFNALEKIAKDVNPKTPVLGVNMSKVLSTASVGKDFLRSRVNWVVQSSAVDYLHLMLVTMKYLCNAYKIDARFMISIHDEVRYLVKEEDAERIALALQLTNIWVRAMFSYKLKFTDLPLGIAFFEAIDLDTVLRKEVDMDCITPSNSEAIAHGRSLDIYSTIKETNGCLLPKGPPPTPTLSPHWIYASESHGHQCEEVKVTQDKLTL
eukprot:CFRG1421T1